MPITPNTFQPYGDFEEYVDAETIMITEVDGTKWMTDRRLLIRADLVEPQPDTDHLWKMRDADHAAVAVFIRKILAAEPVAETELRIAPVYVADAEGADLEIVPSEKVWLLRQDGVTVGCVAPLTPGMGGFAGIQPGDLLPVHRDVNKVLRGEIFDRWHCWNVTFETVAAVTASATRAAA